MASSDLPLKKLRLQRSQLRCTNASSASQMVTVAWLKPSGVVLILLRIQHEGRRTGHQVERWWKTASCNCEDAAEKPPNFTPWWSYQVGIWPLSIVAFDGNPTFSALDTSTEKDIQKALQNLVKGRSSLSIAHRLSVSIVFIVFVQKLILQCCFRLLPQPMCALFNRSFAIQLTEFVFAGYWFWRMVRLLSKATTERYLP